MDPFNLDLVSILDSAEDPHPWFSLSKIFGKNKKD